MSTSVEENEADLKFKKICEEYDICVSSVKIDDDFVGFYADVHFFCLEIHEIQVTLINNNSFEIEIPPSIHSPWSASFPVISFYRNEIWLAIRWVIEGYIKENKWLQEYLKN